MRSRIGTAFLILCFGASGSGVVLAAEDEVPVRPVVVQPYDGGSRDLDQQMLMQDRIDRDQDAALRGVMGDNSKLSQTALRQDAALAQINDTMRSYHNYVMSLDKAKAKAAGPEMSPASAQDQAADKALQSQTLEQKYRFLTDLKQELIRLNDQMDEKIHGRMGKAQIVQRIKEYNEVLARLQNESKTKDALIAEEQEQINLLKSELEERIGRPGVRGGVAALPAVRAEAANGQVPGVVKDMLERQAEDLKDKDDTIGVLKEELAAYKLKTEYNRVTAEINGGVPVRRAAAVVMEENRGGFRDNGDMRRTVASLRDDVRRLTGELSLKQGQIDIMKSELEQNIGRPAGKGKVPAVTAPAVVPALAPDKRLELARQLITLQQKQSALLAEKGDLAISRNLVFEKRVAELEARIKAMGMVAVPRGVETPDRTRQLERALLQKTREVVLLKAELRNKLLEIKDQTDLMERLKQQVANLNAQSDKVTALMNDYQQKLESKGSSYNEQTQELLLARNRAGLLRRQIADLSLRLQNKEAEVVRLKQELYVMRQAAGESEKRVQARDLDLATVQQKVLDGRIMDYKQTIDSLKATNVQQAQQLTDLRSQMAQARQELANNSGHFEPGVEEYQKEFKRQSREFKTLGQQLDEARSQLKQKTEDLKYKTMELERLKERFASAERELRSQIKDLKLRLRASSRGAASASGGEEGNPQVKVEKIVVYRDVNKAADRQRNELETLRAKLKSDDVQIKELGQQLKEARLSPEGEVGGSKLQQALDEIVRQGKIIELLTKKLQASGGNVDVRDADKQ